MMNSWSCSCASTQLETHRQRPLWPSPPPKPRSSSASSPEQRGTSGTAAGQMCSSGSNSLCTWDSMSRWVTAGPGEFGNVGDTAKSKARASVRSTDITMATLHLQMSQLFWSAVLSLWSGTADCPNRSMVCSHRLVPLVFLSSLLVGVGIIVAVCMFVCFSRSRLYLPVSPQRLEADLSYWMDHARSNDQGRQHHYDENSPTGPRDHSSYRYGADVNYDYY